MSRNFPTCHCHPASLDSASTPKAFAEKELQLGTGVLTCTDHGSLAACRTVYDLAKEKGLTPVIGMEAYFRDDDCPIFQAAGIPKTYSKDDQGNDIPGSGTYVEYLKYAHLTIHCLDYAAYTVLCRRLSAAAERAEKHGTEYKPLFGWADLEEIGAQNVTMTSGCLIGMVQRHLLDNNDPQMAIRYYERLRSIAKPGNFYVEIFPHVCDRNYENAVYVTLSNGDKLRFTEKKWLRTNVGERRAAQLCKEWLTEDRRGHAKLLGVKHWNSWTEREPLDIVSVEHKEGFLLNECRPWAKDGDVQRGCNQFVAWLAAKHGDPIIIGDDSHFVSPDEKVAQDIRLMATSGGQWRFHASYHRQSGDEAFRYFSDKLGMTEVEYDRIVDNAYAWASRFKDFKFEPRVTLPTKFYPEKTLEHTMSLIAKHGRMDWNSKPHVDRLTAEIKLLHQNGVIDLLPYFFIDEEVCSLYESRGLLTGPGRGSAAGLLLTYLLGITHIDPLEFDLSLDRFITIDRIKSGKLPDIDQDLPTRELLVGPDGGDGLGGWLFQRFGKCFAQISTDHTLKLKASVLDVARVLRGSVPEDIAALAHKFAEPPQNLPDRDFVFGYEDSGNWEEGSINWDPPLQEYVQRYPEDWKLVQKVLGLTRQKSRHACAYVISNEDIDNFIPTMRINGVRCTQPTAPSVEALGGLKMDFLVINSLNDIQHAIKLIQERSGVEIPADPKLDGKRVPRIRVVPHDGKLYDVWRLWESPRAAEVFQDVSEGKTETMFQFNTGGAIKWLKCFNHKKPNGRKAIDSLEAMSAFTALDRPGPLNVKIQTPDGDEVNMLEEYARRARGLRPAATLPIFSQLLPETHGIMVYQEQLQKLYQYLTGCTGAEAEEFRSNVAKKKVEKILKAYPFFIKGASQKIGEEQAQEVFKFFRSWAQYGFNKSHSICYSAIGLACGYLKHWFPLEWWCSVLRNAEKKEVNEVFWPHCGHLIDLPDVSWSGSGFMIRSTIHGDRIQAPINLLLGVGEGAHNELLHNGPYKDIKDFCVKMYMHKKAGATYVDREDKKTGQMVKKYKLGHSNLHRGVAYTLILAGAMDSLFFKPQEMTLLDKLQEYERCLAAASDEVLPKYTKKKGLLKVTKVEAVDKKYTDVHQLVLYQMRKAVLPAYSVPLVPLMLERGIDGIIDGGPGQRPVWRSGSGDTVFVSAKDVEYINDLRPFPQGASVTCAVAAFIEGVRPFSYAGGSKDACELTLDVEGRKFKFVKWPDRSGKPPRHFTPALKGSVAVVTLSKFAEGRPCAVDDVHVVQQPLDFSAPAERTNDEGDDQ